MDSDGIVWHPPFPLTGAGEFQEAIADCAMLDNLSIVPDDGNEGAYLARLQDGRPVGRLTARNKVAKAIADGTTVLQATINSIGHPDEGGKYPAPRVRIVTGPFGAVLPPPPPEREYTVHIVGEQNYPLAVLAAKAGDPVVLWHEPDNPYDACAIAVALTDGRTLGYLPRDSWLHRVLLDEERSYSATIEQVFEGRRDFEEVALLVKLTGKPLGQREYQPAEILRPSSPVAAMEPKARAALIIQEAAKVKETSPPVTATGTAQSADNKVLLVGLAMVAAIVAVIALWHN